MNHNHFETSYPPDQPKLESKKPNDSLPDLPTSSPNSTCDFYLREIERLGRLPDVKDFLMDTANRDFHQFDNPIDLDAFSEAYSEFIDRFLTDADKSALKNYSGFGYKVINQVARGHWDYDILGRQTPEALHQAQESIADLSQAIARIPSPGVDLVAHRGTNLDSFRSYGINSLSELKDLEGRFFLKEGFTSTSLSPSKSFAGQDFDDPLRRACDISVIYRIPKEAKETIGLLSSETAYNPEQSELLIDKGSLFYISSAELSPDRSSAQLEMTLIPRDLYDPAYQTSTE